MASDSTVEELSHAPVRHGPRLPGFAWLVVSYNVLVIVWGALVRASGSGAGCGNHWPLCNGQVIPVSPGFHTVIEFTHRMMTGGSTFLVIALLVWTFRARPKGHAARFFVVASTILLLNEAILGALLVKLGYVTTNQSLGRMVVLSIHLSNTLLLLAALTLTARFSATDHVWRDLHRGRGLAWGVAGAIATIAVGVSGSLAALGDTLFPASSLNADLAQDFASGAPALLKLRLMHPVSAILSAAFVVWMILRRIPNGASVASRLKALVFVLLTAQLLLGVVDVLLLAPAWMQLLHLLGADLYWIALIALAAEIIWPADMPLRQSVLKNENPSTRPGFPDR
jgi:cytochrome c oxidase assembly protein subunit 15